MNRYVNSSKVLLINLITFIIVSTLFCPIFATDQLDDQILITIDNNICSESYTIDLAKTSFVHFDYITSNNAKSSTVNWKILDQNGLTTKKADIDNNGNASLYDITDEPLNLILDIDDFSSSVQLNIVNSSVPLTISGLSAKNSPLYLSNELNSFNLLDNLIPQPATADLKLEDLKIFYINMDFSIIDGIIYFNGQKQAQTPIKVSLVSDPSIEVYFDVIVTDQVLLEDLEVPAFLDVALNDKTTKFYPKLLPVNNTESSNIKIDYQIKNPKIAEIDSNGNIFPKSLGKTTLTTTIKGVGPYSFSKETQLNIVTEIPIEGITTDTPLIELTTSTLGQDRRLLNVNLIPENTTQRTLNFKTSDSNVVVVDQNGMLMALYEGKATITISDEENHKTLVTVNVSDNKLVADYVSVASSNPDEFTVTAKNVHYNTAFIKTNEIKSVEKVSCFAFSSDSFSDLNAKLMSRIPGTNDWSITFPVNNNTVNNYFENAGNISIHIYGSENLNETGNMISNTNYNYVNHGTSKTNLLITPYVQNMGFITPSVGEGEVAGTIGENKHLEGIRMSTPVNDLSLEYSVYINGFGWTPPVKGGSYAGSMGLNCGIEAVKINLSGLASYFYQIEYRTYIQGIGWTSWSSSNEVSGEIEANKVIEALEARLIRH